MKQRSGGMTTTEIELEMQIQALRGRVDELMAAVRALQATVERQAER